ncbi:hypothetical protein Tco_0437892 [Tanacetum coccineum]
MRCPGKGKTEGTGRRGEEVGRDVESRSRMVDHSSDGIVRSLCVAFLCYWPPKLLDVDKIEASRDCSFTWNSENTPNYSKVSWQSLVERKQDTYYSVKRTLFLDHKFVETENKLKF